MKNIRIFAQHSILKGDFIRLLVVSGIFCACTLHIHGVTPAGNCNGTPAFEVECSGSVAPFFHAAKTNLSVMHSSEKFCLTGHGTPQSNQNPNATVVQKASPEFRELFLSFIRMSYPGIHQLRFKKKRHYYVVRGAFGPRELYSWDKTMETAASRFLNEVKRKVVETPLVLDRPYSSLEMLA